MGLKECEIIFDNPYSTYYAGQTVNGQVLFTFDSPKRVRGIHIRFKGETNTKFNVEETQTNNQNQEEKVTVELTGHEEYFNTHYYLVGSQGGQEIDLPAGQSTYPFTCVLPPTLPSSFEGEYGHVRYTVKVVLDRPWKFDQDTKVAFTVLSPVDLNYNPSLKEPQRITMEKFFCCCWCKSGPLTCVVSIPSRGYVPGQTIPIVAEVDNISNVDVDKVEFAFRKFVTYHTQSPRRETKQDTIVLETITVGPVPGHESKTWNQQLQVPSLPPSNLTNCSLIDLDYELHIECKVSGMHSNLSAKIPLTIGTIPLHGMVPTAPPPVVNGAKPTENDGPSSTIGWVGQPEQPGGIYPPTAPTFAPSQFGTADIRDRGDNQYTRINNSNYQPMYPVYNFGNN